jgi:hypothetical protein
MLNVAQRQRQLQIIGNYYTGKIDGKWGAASRAALRNMQRDSLLTADGFWGSKTELQSVVECKVVQLWVSVYLGVDMTIDGIAGALTSMRIRQAQAKLGLSQTGRSTPSLVDAIRDKLSLTGYITPHVRGEAFRCPCGECNGWAGFTMEYAMQKLKAVAVIIEAGRKLARQRYGSDKEVTVQSGVRCVKYNAKLSEGVGYHTKCLAADVSIPGISSAPIWLEVNPNGGVGYGGGHNPHIDARGKKARWIYK